MKKFFYLFFIVAAFLTLSISCSKAEQDTEIDNPSEEKTVPENATTIRFNISLASEGGKATIASDGKVTWNTGDQVTVYAVDNEGVQGKETVTVKNISDGGTKAEIETVLPAGCTYYAAFPKCESATFNGDVMTVSEPDATTAQTNSNCQVAVSKAEKIGGGSYSLQFKNVNALIKFNVSSDLANTVKSAELVSQSGGAVSYTQVAYNFTNGTSKYAGNTKVTSLKRTVVEGDNFIALAPGVTMSDGFCLKLKDSDGKVVKLFFYDSEFTTARNGGSNISNFETRLYTNLSKDETANCYLINTTDGSKFCFDAKTAGNGRPARTSGDKTSLATVSVTHLWSTLNTSAAPANTTSIVKELKYHKVGYASFDRVSTGNVVVAAKNSSGTIIWSWHLWLPIDKVENVVHFKTGTEMNGTNMLNANLGALKTNYESSGVRDLGFFYQWGRKDPFVSASQRTSTDAGCKNIAYVKVLGAVKDFINRQDITGGKNKLDTTIRHPTWFIRSRDKNDKDNYYDYFRDWYGTSETTPVKFWSIEKTMYDPCPPGYKVPRVLQGPWGYFASGAPWDNTKKGRSFTNQDGKTIWHPAAGFLHRCSGKYSGSKNSLGVNGGYWGVDDDEPVNSSSRGTKMYNYYWYFEKNGCRFNIDISGNYTETGYGKVTDYITTGNTVSGDLSSGRATGRSVRCCKSTEFL